jgi:hypothetical protein
MFVSFRAGSDAILPGFNRGNVDWFRILRAQAKNSLRREEQRRPCEPSREALRKFPQAVRERSPGAIIPSKGQMGSKAGEAASRLSRPGEDTPRPAEGKKQE